MEDQVNTYTELSERWFCAWIDAFSVIYKTKASLQNRFNELMVWDKPREVFTETSVKWIEYNAKLKALNYLISKK